MSARLVALAGLVATASTARAEVRECHVVDVSFTPATNTSSQSQRHEPSQIVVWLETETGQYVDTLYITAQTGRYGLGNRPGRFDFNSGPMWPYGRRVTTFPVWAHRKAQDFPAVVYQNVEGIDPSCNRSCLGAGWDQTYCNSKCVSPDECSTLINDPNNPTDKTEFSDCGDNNLSHPFDESTREQHYCQPLTPTDPRWQQADAMSCATMAFTDKGKLSATKRSLYPPRLDVIRGMYDSPSVDSYKTMAPFDAVSRATPMPGSAEDVSWPLPVDMPSGNYVMWVEVAQAFDHNQTYSTTAYPSPPGSGSNGIYWSEYGLPYRGQPSIIYKVPFTIGAGTTTADAIEYAGYGDPNGVDGNVRPPDATITTTTPGSGASRLELVSDGGSMYRVRVTARPELDYAAPGTPGEGSAIDVGPTSATLRFVAPGDDDQVGTVTSYEVRYFANREMTEDNFADATPATVSITPENAGQLQTAELSGLLPETEYSVGIRAVDDCFNVGPVKVFTFRTADRPVGTVDACFVATAAYGSIMANDVELLRHVRDATLRQSVLGELAVETYYTFGPAVAGVIGQSDLLRWTARDVLAPIIRAVRGLRVQ